MTTASLTDGKTLGINGLGRIGKLTLWHHLQRRYFNTILVNIGREAGTSLKDVAHYIERDSTYGRLDCFLNGYGGEPAISQIDDGDGIMEINRVRVKVLRENRRPADIDWRGQGVRLVVDTTGQFLDPTIPEEDDAGGIRGHLIAGAEKVIVSAPFKVKNNRSIPDDAITTIMGINDSQYDPRRHRIISNASCTTTCLAHMMKPLLNAFGPKRILTASMATVHAATGSQVVLDKLPKKGKTDLRKNRSILNNIILTSTGAAQALRLVIPEMEQIGFIAESVRVPIATGSLIILVVNLQDEPNMPPVGREIINDIYRQAEKLNGDKYLHFSEKQNVSGDIIGLPRSAAIIEGHETHTRTAEVTLDLAKIKGIPIELLKEIGNTVVRAPVTQAVVYGWYDNEYGSYVNMLGDRTVSVAEEM